MYEIPKDVCAWAGTLEDDGAGDGKEDRIVVVGECEWEGEGSLSGSAEQNMSSCWFR